MKRSAQNWNVSRTEYILLSCLSFAERNNSTRIDCSSYIFSSSFSLNFLTYLSLLIINCYVITNCIHILKLFFVIFLNVVVRIFLLLRSTTLTNCQVNSWVPFGRGGQGGVIAAL